MKKIVVILITVVLSFCMAACVQIDSSSEEPLDSSYSAAVNQDVSAQTAAAGNSAVNTETVVTIAPADTPAVTPEPTPTPIPTVKVQTVEDKIRKALSSKSSYAFKISDDFQFTEASGYKVNKDKDGTTKANQSEKWSMDYLISYSSGNIIRIDGGKATMVDSTDYTCSLKESDDGISLTIKHVADQSISSQIDGLINGNILTASEEIDTAYYFTFTKSGYGTHCAGKYSVSLKGVSKSDIPPTPVVLKTAINDDKSVTLNWTDQSPSGHAAYYEIYRQIAEYDFELADTVKGETTWTDSSQDVKDNLFLTVTYYIIAYNSAGLASPKSNYEICVGPVG